MCNDDLDVVVDVFYNGTLDARAAFFDDDDDDEID